MRKRLYFWKFYARAAAGNAEFSVTVTVTDTVDLPLLGGRPPAALPPRRCVVPLVFPAQAWPHGFSKRVASWCEEYVYSGVVN